MEVIIHYNEGKDGLGHIPILCMQRMNYLYSKHLITLALMCPFLTCCSFGDDSSPGRTLLPIRVFWNGKVLIFGQPMDVTREQGAVYGSFYCA